MAPPNGVTYQDIPNPEFAIVGASHPSGEGVVLLASRHITYAQLKALAQDTIPLQAMTPGWMKTGVFLSLAVGIDDYVLVAAEDYPSAFEILFTQWQPKRRANAIETYAQLAALEAQLAPKLAIEADQGGEGPDF